MGTPSFAEQRATPKNGATRVRSTNVEVVIGNPRSVRYSMLNLLQPPPNIHRCAECLTYVTAVVRRETLCTFSCKLCLGSVARFAAAFHPSSPNQQEANSKR
eukprot:2848563-Amphidinium_carterae.1